MKKNLTLYALFLLTQFAFAQESVSFLTKNSQVGFMENLEEINSLETKWQLDFAKYVTMDDSNYLSDFQVFSPIDSRFMNYPSQDFTDHNQLLLGNYSMQRLKLGNLQMNTIYLFDVTGRLVDYQTNFSLWKSKK